MRCRSYESTTDGVAGLDISLRVHGVQYTDGRLETRLALSGEGLNDLSPGSAREVAGVPLEVVERCNRTRPLRPRPPAKP